MDYTKIVTNLHTELYNEITNSNYDEIHKMIHRQKFEQITNSFRSSKILSMDSMRYFSCFVSKCTTPELYQICYLFSNISGACMYINENKFKATTKILKMVIQKMELDTIIM